MHNININFGFIHQEKFIKTEEVEALNNKFEYINNKKLYSSPCDHIIQLTPKETYIDPVFERVCKKIEHFFANNIGLTDLKLAKLWLVTSQNKNTDSSILPYIPHFDKHRCLKAMVYLHDVTEKHGPIHLGQISNHVNIEHRRNELPPDYKALGLNIINEEDILDKMIPMTGLAGDVVFFDTNAPHKAGIVKKDHERRVLRFDFDLDGLNAKSSFIKRVLSRFYK